MIPLSMIPEPEKRRKFEEIYMQDRKLLMHTAMKILNNHTDSEDCVSEAFLRAAKMFDRICDLERPKQTALLVIIVRNLAIDVYRRNKRTSAAESPELLSGKVSFDSYPVYSVTESIKQLKPEYRDILMLRYVYGYGAEETAQLLGITTDNVYKRVQRAKSALAKLLEDGDDNG